MADRSPRLKTPRHKPAKRSAVEWAAWDYPATVRPSWGDSTPPTGA